MTKTTNVMAIAPTPAASKRTTSQGTQQPRYKTTQRTGKRNFGSTLDQVHAKLDELKQSVQDLQDANKKLAQVEEDAQPINTQKKAQGTSEPPQEDGKAMGNNSTTVADEDIQPADIFLDENKPVNAAYLFVTNSETLLETKPVVETPKSDSVPSLMSIMPQTNQGNSQSMLNMLGGRSWRLIEPQPLDVQPNIQPQAVDTPQPLDVQPSIQPQVVNAAQPLDVQPSIQPQVVNAAQPVDVQPSIQPQVVAAPAQIQQTAQSQPFIAPQRIDERPTVQNFSELLGVKVEVAEVPTSAPVTPPQSTPQQFNQEPQQQDAHNFQQTLQSTVDAPQAQAVSTGGEVFVAPVATGNDAPQPQAPTQTTDAPPMPQEDFDIPAQIVRQAKLIRTAENTEMVIKLNPEHLGELTLRVSVSANGAVNASFHSDNAQVRTIIENSLVQLRQELSNIGLKVEHVDVYAGLSDGGLMNGQGGQAWQQNRQQRQGNRRLDIDKLERDVETTAPVNESTTEGVDYSV